MPTTSSTSALVALAAVLLCACDSPADVNDGALINTGTVSLRSVAEVYNATTGQTVIDGSLVSYLDLTVFLVYRNRAGRTVYISACRAPHEPRLERLVNGSWEPAYVPEPAACADSLIAVRSRWAYPYQFQIRAYQGAPGLEPAWLGSSDEGLYRVHWQDAIWLDSARTQQLPMAQRVSNPFHVVGTLP